LRFAWGKSDEISEKEAHRRQAAKLARLDHQEARAIPRGPLRRRMRGRRKPLPWRHLISATSSVGGSWCRKRISTLALARKSGIL
jgi:hypothetical protein